MKWEIIDDALAYDGFHKLYRLRLNHAAFRGGNVGIRRELIRRGHVVGVLPYDAVRDSVVMIEQFRVGALESPHGPWLMEIIAGLVDPGETFEEVARREAMEEAGCRLGELLRLHEYWSSPGNTNERVILFAAQIDSEGVGGIHGLAHEGEDIRVHVMSADEAIARMEAGGIDSAVPIIALQWLRANRENLRARWGTK